MGVATSLVGVAANLVGVAASLVGVASLLRPRLGLKDRVSVCGRSEYGLNKISRQHSGNNTNQTMNYSRYSPMLVCFKYMSYHIQEIFR